MTEDKLPKIDTGQIKEETEGDGRDREREWNYKNNNHHITHTTNVSSKFLVFFLSLLVANEITKVFPTNHLLKPQSRAYWLPIEYSVHRRGIKL